MRGSEAHVAACEAITAVTWRIGALRIHACFVSTEGNAYEMHVPGASSRPHKTVRRCIKDRMLYPVIVAIKL